MSPDFRARTLSDEQVAEAGWLDLLAILDKHYPASLFPTLPDNDDRDPGPRIVSLIRLLASRDQRIKTLEGRIERLVRDQKISWLENDTYRPRGL